MPGQVRWVLKRCLEKNPEPSPARHWRSSSRASSRGEADTDPPPGVGPRSAVTFSPNAFARVLPWVVAALGVVAAVAVWLLVPTSARLPPRKLDLALPTEGTGFALSPDGQRLAFFESGQVRTIDLRRSESRDLAPAPAGARRSSSGPPIPPSSHSTHQMASCGEFPRMVARHWSCAPFPSRGV